MSDGTGYFGGYGAINRSAYATPAELGPKPWTLDFSVDDGWPAFPTRLRVDPNQIKPPLEWTTDDWDPGLRFWTLDFDTQLQEWLQDVDLSSPAVMAAREFARGHEAWKASDTPSAGTIASAIPAGDLKWRVFAGHTAATAWTAIAAELQALEDLMHDDRARYLDEAAVQSDGIPLYFTHFMGISTASKPWTAQLMRCGLAIGNLVYMHYKAHYKRVRPSTLCAGLVPPWGPPRHPSFPSGHSFLGHFIALLLLEIGPVADRFGVFPRGTPNPHLGSKPTLAQYNAVGYGDDIRSPLLWLAWRLAKNRERIGVHYRSDSSASRALAGAVWDALCGAAPTIAVPTLHMVLTRARAEWQR